MTETPPGYAERPGAADATADVVSASRPPHDLLSELLRSVRLTGERVVAYAPPPTFSIGFRGVGALHMPEAGELELQVDGDAHVERVRRGDAILVPRGDAHHIGNPARPGVPASARWLCGTFTIGDPHASHLLPSLPPAIVLRGAQGPALEGLEVARRMIGVEMDSPSQGSAVMVARILDLLFIQILRAWAAGANAQPTWLAGALDPQIGPALSAIHRNPGHDWSVDGLARTCSLSRSAFAARFAERVGTPPGTYLAHVRLNAATDLLRDTRHPVAHIAANVGYTSEAAFSRAFRQRYGTPPARWRRDSARATATE